MNRNKDIFGDGLFYDLFPDARSKTSNTSLDKMLENLSTEDIAKRISELTDKNTADLEKLIGHKLDVSEEHKNLHAPVIKKPEPVLEEVVEEDETDPMEELNNLVGLEDLKKDVSELINLVKMNEIRKKRGLKSIPVSLHLVFSGNPGTGKTTVARILSRIYKKIGVLSKGHLVEVDRSSLVAGYVGQTAIKTQEKINEAKGGILFIDEAYTLAKEGNDFGQEAIDTLLKAMEDNREDFIVIVAGYTDLMEIFINSNPGLKSRFNKYLNFKDYTEEELFQIFLGLCKKYDYELDEGALEEAKKEIQDLLGKKKENFANAREVRNLFEKAITRQATRIGANLDEANLTLLTKVDIDDDSEYVDKNPKVKKK